MADLDVTVAFLPNRAWSKDEERWMYLPTSQHDRDVEVVRSWAARREVEAKEKTHVDKNLDKNVES